MSRYRGHTERGGGGFSGLNDKPDTEGHPYLIIFYSCRVPKIYFELDAMNNPQKSISRDTITIAPIFCFLSEYPSRYFDPVTDVQHLF